MITNNIHVGTRKNKHISRDERISIETLYKQGYPVAEIASILERHRSTIYREIKRGTVIHRRSDLKEITTYNADRGQTIYILNHSHKAHYKIKADADTLNYISRKMLYENKSPDIVWCDMVKANRQCIVCTKTIYRLIDSGLIHKVTNETLAEKEKRKGRRKVKKVAKLSIPIGKSIDKRPFDKDDRTEFGHWEMDLIEGCKNGSGKVLLTIIERKTRFQIIKVLASKKQSQVTAAINKIEREYGQDKFKQIFKTITTDNGPEFRNYKTIEKSVFNKQKRTKMYYAHPFASWERGSNENGNRFIRRFIEKGSDINDYTVLEIQQTQDWINNYPRKVIGYKSAKEYLEQELSIA